MAKTYKATKSGAMHIANINKIRYRVYYYDPDTGFYYLQSHYYNPTWGRFINADDIDFLGADEGLLSYNLFAYCENNPLKYADYSGTFLNTIIGGIVGAISGGISAAINGDNVWAGIGIGAATGALAGLAVDFAVATGGVGAIAIVAVGGALASGANYAGTELTNGRSVDSGVLAVEASVGALANLLTFGVSGGSTAKVAGNTFNNMKKNLCETVMTNTTRKVAGKLIKKSTTGIAKNIAKNLLTETAKSTIIYGGSFIIEKKIEYNWMRRW